MFKRQAAWETMLCALALGTLAVAASADDKRPLSDAELDAVTAGTASASDDGLLTFEAVKRTRSGKTVTAHGNLEVVESLRGITIGGLTLSDNAQSNLQSVVSINAVNSAVNVLLNLNVTIDSSVGTLNQLNVNTPLPTRPALPGP